MAKKTLVALAAGGRAEIVAHRGASASAPEHSFAAYDLALAQGADAIELDLRETADGELVVLHDPTLRRTTADPRAIASLPAVALESLPAATRPPLLRTVLERYGRRTRYLVELKDPTPALERRALAALRVAGLRDRAVIQSFDHASLRRLRALDPSLAVAPLLRAVPAAGEEFLDDLAANGAVALGVHHQAVDAGLLAAAHRRGLGVRAWTVNEAVAAERLLGLGVDGLITDLPGSLAAA
jgi:glycerophosphoryl diester phosphodiesterase